ncbi:MAG TPA: hypothetical protein VFV33_06220 [Gemmatimonadaceae bacterium]|nr:hypothetical protein [Gemmatimonadaceae bacterium]
MLELVPMVAGALVGRASALLLTERHRGWSWGVAALAGVAVSALAGEPAVSLAYPATDALLGCAGFLAARAAESAWRPYRTSNR